MYPAVHTDLGRPTQVREITPAELDLLLSTTGWNVLERWSFDHPKRHDWDHSSLTRVQRDARSDALWQHAQAEAHGVIASWSTRDMLRPRGDYQLVVAGALRLAEEGPPAPIYREGRAW